MNEEIEALIRSIDAMAEMIKTNRAKFTSEQLEDLGNCVEDFLSYIDEAIESMQ